MARAYRHEYANTKGLLAGLKREGLYFCWWLTWMCRSLCVSFLLRDLLIHSVALLSQVGARVISHHSTCLYLEWRTVLGVSSRSGALVLDFKVADVAELYVLTRRQSLTDGVKKRFYQGFTVSTSRSFDYRSDADCRVLAFPVQPACSCFYLKPPLVFNQAPVWICRDLV